MKRNESNSKVRRDSIGTLLKLLFISSLFLFVSINNANIMGEGFFILKEVNSALLKEGERGTVLCAKDDFLYLLIENSAETEEFADLVQIIDVQQPESPIVVGRYELAINETLLQFQIQDNIAYLLSQKYYSGAGNWSVTLLNITEPANSIQIGSTVVENITRLSPIPWYLSTYNNYIYVNTNFELIIFDCSNPISPVKVANHTSSSGKTHITNDFLYLVFEGVKIFDLTDPVNPAFLGEVNSTKNTSAGSGVYGNYVIQAFKWFGIQVYNCSDPSQPTICGNYDFPEWEFDSGGQIQDMEIVGERLFAGKRKLYVFDLSEPQNLVMIARKIIGSDGIRRISVLENYIYLTIHSNIIIYSYVENSLGRNLGIGIGVGLTVVVGASLFIRWKKKRG